MVRNDGFGQIDARRQGSGGIVCHKGVKMGAKGEGKGESVCHFGCGWLWAGKVLR